MVKIYSQAKNKRQIRTRSKTRGITGRPRLSVFRSSKYIYAQIIDDQKGITLTAASEKDIKPKTQATKTDKAELVGEVLAKKALAKKIKKVKFDRGAFQYHGRVMALAEGARKAGLEF